MTKQVQARIAGHIANLGHDDMAVGRRAERYLIERYRDRAFDLVVEATYSPDMMTRLRAGWILGKWQDPRGWEHLLRLMEDPDGFIRYDIAIALGNFGDERAIPILIALMQVDDQESYVDGAAADGLTRFKERAVPALLAALPDMTPNGRLVTTGLLGHFGDKRALGTLEEMLSDPALRESAQESIEMINDPDWQSKA